MGSCVCSSEVAAFVTGCEATTAVVFSVADTEDCVSFPQPVRHTEKAVNAEIARHRTFFDDISTLITSDFFHITAIVRHKSFCAGFVKGDFKHSIIAHFLGSHYHALAEHLVLNTISYIEYSTALNRRFCNCLLYTSDAADD